MTDRVRKALAYATAAKSGAAAALRNAELAENLLLEELAADPAPPVERVAHGPGRLREATTTFGPPLGPVPKGWLLAFLDRALPAKAASMAARVAAEAAQKGAGNVVLSVPLSWQQKGAKQDPAGSLAAMQAVADGHHDALFVEVALALLDAGYPHAVIRLGWEHNMLWPPWSSAGDRAPVFVAAWQRAATIIRESAPGIALDWCVGSSGADPDAPGGGEIDEDAWPGDDLVDIVGRDVYCRSNGRRLPLVAAELDAHLAFAARHGKPVSFPEVGVTLPVVGVTSTVAATDSIAADFTRHLLAVADAADLAYLVWWASGRDDQGYRYRPTPADKRTWVALEAAYG